MFMFIVRIVRVLTRLCLVCGKYLLGVLYYVLLLFVCDVSVLSVVQIHEKFVRTFFHSYNIILQRNVRF